MSLSERPFLFDVMGCSLKILFSNGCCCLKCRFFVRISFPAYINTNGFDFPAKSKMFLQGMTKTPGICTSLEGAVGCPKRCSNMRGCPKLYGFGEGDAQNAETPAGLPSFPGPGQFFSHASGQVGSLSSIA